MTGDGTDAASESNVNLFTLPSREEENDEVVNRGKPGVNSVTLQRGVSESLRICLQFSYSRLCGWNRLLADAGF